MLQERSPFKNYVLPVALDVNSISATKSCLQMSQ